MTSKQAGATAGTDSKKFYVIDPYRLAGIIQTGEWKSVWESGEGISANAGDAFDNPTLDAIIRMAGGAVLHTPDFGMWPIDVTDSYGYPIQYSMTDYPKTPPDKSWMAPYVPWEPGMVGRVASRRWAALAGSDSGVLYAISPEALHHLIEEGNWIALSRQSKDGPSEDYDDMWAAMDVLIRQHGGAVLQTADGNNNVTTPGGTGRGYLPPYGTSSYGRIGPDVGDGAIPPEDMTEQDMIDEASRRVARQYIFGGLFDQGPIGDNVDFEPDELNPQGAFQKTLELPIEVVGDPDEVLRKLGFDVPTPEAKEKYLKEHPKGDPKNVVVKPTTSTPAKTPEKPSAKKPGMKLTPKDRENIVKQFIGQNSGFTYDAVKHRFVHHGFSVSTHPESEEAIPEKDVVGPDGKISKKAMVSRLQTYFKKHGPLLAQPHSTFGGYWSTSGHIVLDVSQTETSKEKAIELGKQHHQESIFDHKNKDVVMVDPDSARARWTTAAVAGAHPKSGYGVSVNIHGMTPDQAAELATAALMAEQHVKHQEEGAAKTARRTASMKKRADAVQKVVQFQDMSIPLDRPTGFKQKLDTPEGPTTRTYTCDYGFFPGTQDNDGEELDVFVGPEADSEKVFVIRQLDHEGNFDEHKVGLGFENANDFINTYGDHIPLHLVDGVEEMGMDDFKQDFLNQG